MNKNKVSAKPLNILMILLCITGIGYYLYCYKNNIFIYWQYNEDILSNVDKIAKYLNYSKDIFILLWCISIIVKNYHKLQKEIFITIMIILLGAILSLINGYSILVLIAGIRAYIYCFTIFIFFKSNINDIGYSFWNSIIRTIKFIILLQLISIILIIIKSKDYFLPGQGGYRMMGLFTNAGTLGALSIGSTIIISYIYIVKKIINTRSFFIWTLGCIILATCSGSRSAMLNGFMILMIGIFSKSRIDEKSKNLIIIILSIIIIPFIIGISIRYIDRGALMDSGQGRFTPWLELFYISNLLQVIFGRGLGFGTNIAYNINQCKFVFDSTFVTVILQYGLIGFTIFIIYLYKIIYGLIKNNKENRMYILYIIVYSIISIFSGNLFEMYVWSIPLCMIVFDMIYKGKNYT